MKNTCLYQHEDKFLLISPPDMFLIDLILIGLLCVFALFC